MGKRSHTDDDDAPRNKKKRSANAPVLSGTLGSQLEAHAFERCRHFFMYLSAIRRIEFVMNAADPNAKIDALSGLVVKATDQIDDGFRVEDDVYADFDNADEDVVLL